MWLLWLLMSQKEAGQQYARLFKYMWGWCVSTFITLMSAHTLPTFDYNICPHKCTYVEVSELSVFISLR